MELILAAIVIGVFILISVWLKHYLDELTKHPQTASKTEENKKASTFFKYATIQGAISFFTSLIALHEGDSLIISLPILGIIGLIVARLAERSKLGTGLLIGLSATAISILCFISIFGFRMSPDDAERFIAPIVLIYTVFLALVLPIYIVKSKTRMES